MAVTALCNKVFTYCAYKDHQTNDLDGVKNFLDHLDKEHNSGSAPAGTHLKDALVFA